MKKFFYLFLSILFLSSLLFANELDKELIDKKFDQIMKENNVFFKKTVISDILDTSIIELKFAYELLKKEYLKNKNIIYSAKIND